MQAIVCKILNHSLPIVNRLIISNFIPNSTISIMHEFIWLYIPLFSGSLAAITYERLFIFILLPPYIGHDEVCRVQIIRAFTVVWVITLFFIICELHTHSAFSFISSLLTVLFGFALFLLGTLTAIFSGLWWKNFYITQYTLAGQALGSCGIGVIGAIIGLNQVLAIDLLFGTAMKTLWRRLKSIAQHRMLS
jgi:hypothetical protein